MNRTCPECGLVTFSIDDLYCPGCRTFLSHRMTVRQLKQEAERPTAKAVTKRKLDADERAKRVRRMRAKGMTHAAIAKATGWDVSTVSRLLKRPLT